mmetsp:Transcript_18112/g.45425  ORF Transcript_18112/g.45425 Transcript_18112/m.45425 type:complete len:81 (+) Transcript_18112:213-455(+)
MRAQYAGAVGARDGKELTQTEPDVHNTCARSDEGNARPPEITSEKGECFSLSLHHAFSLDGLALRFTRCPGKRVVGVPDP